MLFTTVGGHAYSLFLQQSNSNEGGKDIDLEPKNKEHHIVSPHFEKVPFPIGSTGTGYLTAGYSIAVGDYDCDGLLDLFVGEWRFDFLRPDRQVFNESTAAASLKRFSPLWQPASASSDSRLLRNTGGGIFEDVTDESGLSGLIEFSRKRVGGQALDNKKYASHSTTSETGSRYGETAGSIPLRDFVPPGMFTFASLLQDLDDDGFPDLIIAADFGTSSIWWNDGQGHFIERDSGCRNGRG